MTLCRLVLCCGCMGLTSAIPQTGRLSQGVIRGIVDNDRHLPVEGARVTAWLMDNKILRFPIRYVETDKDGKFAIDGLDWGPYRIFAMKESDGYPNMRYAIYDNGSAFSARLSPQSPTASVTVLIGPKAGVVRARVSNAATGTPIPAGVRIWRWGDEGDFLGTTIPTNFRVLIPPGVQVGFDVEVRGYKIWYYPGPGATSPGEPLVLHSDETLDLDIKLQPE